MNSPSTSCSSTQENGACHLALKPAFCLFKVSDNIILNTLQGCYKYPVGQEMGMPTGVQVIALKAEVREPGQCVVLVSLFTRGLASISPAPGS